MIDVSVSGSSTSNKLVTTDPIKPGSGGNDRSTVNDVSPKPGIGGTIHVTTFPLTLSGVGVASMKVKRGSKVKVTVSVPLHWPELLVMLFQYVVTKPGRGTSCP